MELLAVESKTDILSQLFEQTSISPLEPCRLLSFAHTPMDVLGDHILLEEHTGWI
jgi:hypothetical protein